MVIMEVFWEELIGFRILSILILLPILASISIAFKRDPNAVRWEALVVSLVQVVLGVLLFVNYAAGVPAMQFVEHLPWIKPLGVSYHIGVDGISLFLVIFTTILTPLLILYSWDRIKERVAGYMVCLLLLESLMIGAFVALDLVLFFFFWELMLIPMYFLIRNWGTGEGRDHAALKYVVYNLLGSLLMLIGFIILYLNHHEWAMGQRGRPEYSFGYIELLLAPLSASKQLWVFVLIFLGFAVKGPIFPFHTWMPGVMLNGPIAVGVLLSGIKLGSYGLLRFNIPFAPQASDLVVPVMMALSLIGLLYGAFIALTHQNLMTMMAYAGISHLGFVTIGLFALNTTGISGAVLQMVNFGIVGAGIMFVLAFLMDRMDGSLSVADYGGVAKKAPVFASLSLVIVLASLALPGTNVFVGEFLILVGVFQVNWIYAVIGVIAVIFTAAYMLWMYERVMLGKAEKPKILEFRDLNSRESFILSVMVVLILWIGLYPAPLLTRMEPSVKLVVERVEEGRRQARATAQRRLVDPHAYFEIISDEEAVRLMKGSASGRMTGGSSGKTP